MIEWEGTTGNHAPSGSMGHHTRRVRSHIATEQATRYRTHTIKEEPSLRCLRCTPLLWQTPVVPRHCQLATATINLQVPSLSGEWTPPVVRQGTTAYPAQLCSHLPYDRRGKRCTLSCALSCGRAGSAPSSSNCDPPERPPSSRLT